MGLKKKFKSSFSSAVSSVGNAVSGGGSIAGGVLSSIGNALQSTVARPLQKAGEQVVNQINPFTNKPYNTIQKAGSNLINKTGNAVGTALSQTGNAIGTAVGQTQDVISEGINNIGKETGTVLNKTGNALEIAQKQTGNFFKEAYSDAKTLANKIVDLPDALKPKLGSQPQQPARGVGITDIAGRRRKRGSNYDTRAGLASTILSNPSSLLGSGNGGGLGSTMGKAKLGQ